MDNWTASTHPASWMQSRCIKIKAKPGIWSGQDPNGTATSSIVDTHSRARMEGTSHKYKAGVGSEIFENVYQPPPLHDKKNGVVP